MASRSEALILDQVLQIRQVQRGAAESALARAQADVADLERRRIEQTHDLERDGRAWLETLNAGRFDLGLAQAWRTQVLNRQADLAATAAALETANAAQSTAEASLALAIGRADVAADLTRKASRRWRRKQDEARLDAQVDRYAPREAAP